MTTKQRTDVTIHRSNDDSDTFTIKGPTGDHTVWDKPRGRMAVHLWGYLSNNRISCSVVRVRQYGSRHLVVIERTNRRVRVVGRYQNGRRIDRWFSLTDVTFDVPEGSYLDRRVHRDKLVDGYSDRDPWEYGSTASR